MPKVQSCNADSAILRAAIEKSRKSRNPLCYPSSQLWRFGKFDRPVKYGFFRRSNFLAKRDSRRSESLASLTQCCTLCMVLSYSLSLAVSKAEATKAKNENHFAKAAADIRAPPWTLSREVLQGGAYLHAGVAKLLPLDTEALLVAELAKVGTPRDWNGPTAAIQVYASMGA
jgi:hypothetical protein